MTGLALDGRVALVTGAGRGIGAAIVRALAAAGASVVVNDLDASATDVVARLRAAGAQAVPVQCDVSTDAATAVNAAVDAFGRLDVLVNNAGGGHGGVPLSELTPEQWNASLASNLTSQLLCSQAAAPIMARNGFGRIVNIASRAWLGQPGYADYASAKGGVVSLTRTLALELAPLGITANVVAPGTISTPALEGLPEEFKARLRGEHPAGRFGDPEDVARAVLFFAAPAAGRITGQVLHVCGGRTLSRAGR